MPLPYIFKPIGVFLGGVKVLLQVQLDPSITVLLPLDQVDLDPGVFNFLGILVWENNKDNNIVPLVISHFITTFTQKLIPLGPN